VLSVIGGLQFDRWYVAAVLVEAAVVEPVDPFGSSQLDLFDGPPRSAWSDQLGFVQTVDRLGRRVVIGLPTAPTEGWIPASASRSDKRIEVY
jgi:hypothetical protein